MYYLPLIYQVISQFIFVSNFASMRVYLDDQITGDRPGVTGRLNSAINLMFASTGLISVFFPLTAIMRLCLVAPAVVIFALEGLVRYEGVSRQTLKKLWYPVAMLLAIVLYPSIELISLISISRVLLASWGYSVAQDDFSAPKESKRWHMRWVQKAVHFLAVHFTTGLVLLLAGGLSFALWTQVALTIPAMVTLGFVALYALRDFRWLSPEMNPTLNRVRGYASVVQSLRSGMGWLLLTLLYGIDGIVKPIVSIFNKRIRFFSESELEYRYSTVEKPETSFAERLVGNTAPHIQVGFKVTRELLMGAAYNFNAKASEPLDETLARILPLLKEKLPEDFSLQIEPSTANPRMVEKKGIQEDLVFIVDRILHRSGNIAATLAYDDLLGIISGALLKLEQHLENDEMTDASEYIRRLLAEKETCPGGLYRGYKTQFPDGQNLPYLFDIENKKRLDVEMDYQYILSDSVNGILSPFLAYKQKDMRELLNMLSPHDNNDVHKFHDFCGIYSGGHYTLAHAAAETDNGSFASVKGLPMLGWTSYMAVNQWYNQKWSDGVIKGYLEAVQDGSRLSLWQSKADELSSLTVDQVKTMHDNIGFTKFIQAWEKLQELANRPDFLPPIYPSDVVRHIESDWWTVPGFKAVMQEEFRMPAVFLGEDELSRLSLNRLIELISDNFDVQKYLDRSKDLESLEDDDVMDHLNTYWFEELSDPVLLTELESIGYVAQDANIKRPTVWTYLPQIWTGIKALSKNTMRGVFSMIEDITSLLKDLIKVPFRMVDFTFQCVLAGLERMGQGFEVVWDAFKQAAEKVLSGVFYVTEVVSLWVAGKAYNMAHSKSGRAFRNYILSPGFSVVTAPVRAAKICVNRAAQATMPKHTYQAWFGEAVTPQVG